MAIDRADPVAARPLLEGRGPGTAAAAGVGRGRFLLTRREARIRDTSRGRATVPAPPRSVNGGAGTNNRGLEGKRMASGHTGNVVPGNRLWVRIPCPPLNARTAFLASAGSVGEPAIRAGSALGGDVSVAGAGSVGEPAVRAGR